MLLCLVLDREYRDASGQEKFERQGQRSGSANEVRRFRYDRISRYASFGDFGPQVDAGPMMGIALIQNGDEWTGIENDVARRRHGDSRQLRRRTRSAMASASPGPDRLMEPM